MTTVFVSGATGYIAKHVVQQLLDKKYKVVGSVRTTEKGEALAKDLNSSDFTYEVVPDIAAKGCFDDALKKHPEVTVFLHTASPFHFAAKDFEKDMLVPAIEGTRNALNAIKDHGPQVKNVVVTSSFAAVMNSSPSHPQEKPSYTEESWNPVTWEEALADGFNAYIASKKFAEEEAWNFVNKEKPQFKLSVVNPTYVFGPQLKDTDVKGTLNTSAEVINSLLKLKATDEVPNLQGPFTDVRDSAKAHLFAFENSEAVGQRLLLWEEGFTSQEVLDIIHKHFPELNDKLPKGTPGSGVKPVGIDDKTAIDNAKTRKLLGSFINLEKSVVDTVAQVLRANK